jgi:uncharacterized delta-60 repeat protein
MTITKVDPLAPTRRAPLLLVIGTVGIFLLVLPWLVFAERQTGDSQTVAQAGAVDPSFNPVVGKQGQAFAVAVQSDGKIIVGGVFNSYGGVSRNGLVRVNADGSLDPTFNPGTGIDSGGFHGISKIAIQPDGKIVVAGGFTEFNGVGRKNILRLNSNGSLDTSFNPGSGTDFELSTLALQSDGKILIGGFFTLYNGVSRRNLARLNSDGSLDTGFDTGTGPESDVLGIAVQPDGKILLAGEFVSYNGISRNYVARTNSNGTLDTSFDTGGSKGANNDVLTLALQPDGRIVIGGLFLQYDGVVRNRIARISADGSLDTSFEAAPGPGGNPSNSITSLVLQPDGKILAAGSFLNFSDLVRPGIVRINSTGSVDPAFNPNSGTGSLSVDELALQSDGKVLLAGVFSSYDGAPRSGLARANSNGSVDSTFFDLLSPGPVHSISVQLDGKIVIGGAFSKVNGVSRNGLARLNADGSLDNLFNPGSGADSTVLDTALQTDGRIVIGGTFATYNGVARSGIARVNADGSLDTSFNPGTGISGSFRQLNALVVQTDGKILLGGLFTSFNSVARNRIARVNVNGSLDTSFDPGTGINSSAGGTPFVNDLVVQPDGKVVVTGSFLSYNSVVRANFVRINPDGSLDSSFNPGNGPVGITTGLALQPNGKILVGGAFSQFSGVNRGGIARVDNDGSLDTSFDPGSGTFNIFAIAVQTDSKIVMGGLVNSYNGVNRGGLARAYSDGGLDISFEAGGINERVVEIVQLPTGETLVCGDFTQVGGVDHFGIARLLGDSSSPTPTPTPTTTPSPGACLDTTFDTDGKVTTDFDSRTESLEAIALQTDGKIVAVGTSNSAFAVARYNINGSLDTSFDGDGKVISSFATSDQVRAVAIQTDGKIVVGGTTDSHSFALARFNSNGSLDTTFDSDGKVITDFQAGSGSERINDLILQSDGKIVAVGGASNGFALARYNANGSLDTSFGTAGKVVTTFNDQAAALGVAIQSDGKIVAGGGRDNAIPPQGDFVLARYNANGTLDATFDGDGKTSLSFGPFRAVANDLALQPDGKIILAGTVRFDLGIARFNSDGSLDNNFGIGGKIMSDFAFTSDQGMAVTLQPNGKIFVIGDGTRNGASNLQLLRLNSNGTVDTSFAAGGRLATDFSTNDTGGSLIIQPDGKLIVAGSALNSSRDFALARYNSACLQSPTWEPVVLTSNQVELKTWVLQGRTYAYVKLAFPNDGYRVASWGQSVNAGSVYSVDAAIENFTGLSVQAVTTTAQIYDLGPLANGNYTFTFKNSGTTVKSLAFTISLVAPPANPIDNAREFVRQQYRDFLNREADQAGEDFWTDNITKCSDPARRPPGQTQAQCRLRQRETTSAAFFLSPEFQYTGYYVYRMFVGGLGRPPKLSEFTPDALFVGNGIIVSGQLSAAKINQNKADFAAQFVNCTDTARYRCAEFKAIYDNLTNQQYVARLFTNTGVNASAADRTALVNALNGGTETRASVLRKVVDGINVIAEGNQQFTTSYGQAFYNSELNEAFVQLEYFGYMKRDPDAAGYAFWLGKLNQFGGDFVQAEMVLAFISSPEYRARFGQP